jgi:hypothetical protein
MLMLSLVILPLLLVVVMPFLIPFLAWKGRPHGFKRLQWVGVAIGSGILELVALGFCIYVGGKPFDRPGSATDVVYTALQTCTAVFLSTAFGSLMALFFWRPSGTAK